MTTIRAATPVRLPGPARGEAVRCWSLGLTILDSYGEKDQGRTDGSSHPKGRGEDGRSRRAPGERPVHATDPPGVQGKLPLGADPPAHLPDPRHVDHRQQLPRLVAGRRQQRLSPARPRAHHARLYYGYPLPVTGRGE